MDQHFRRLDPPQLRAELADVGVSIERQLVDGVASADPMSRRAFADTLALGLLLALAVWYFLPHVLGQALFIGDSDRMSHFFTWLIHLNNGVRHGYLPTWNDSLFGGYSTVGLPYVYYNPLAFVGLAFRPGLQNWVAGWTSMFWLWLAGVALYAFIRYSVPSAFCAFVGAALYQSSAVLVLKISQNEGTFSVNVLTPLLLLCIQAARPGHLAPWLFIASIAFAYLFSVSFLQEAAYACLLIGLFAVYRSATRQQWTPMLVASAAVVPAFVVSLPRLVNVATELKLSNRGGLGGFNRTWQALGAFNPFELLRLLDDRILGRYFSHAIELGNGINLHEGMVAYVSTYAVVVVLIGVLWYVARGRRQESWRRMDIPFHILFALFCLAVPLTQTAYWIMYHLFFKIGFIHARVTTAAMPSLCALAAMFLYLFASPGDDRGVQRIPTFLMLTSIFACGTMTALIELLSLPLVDTRWPVRYGAMGVVVSTGAALRIFLSLLIGIGLLAGSLWLVQKPVWRAVMVRALGVLAVMQVAVYAKDQTSGDFMYSDGLPYRTPTRLLARADEFRIPSAAAKAELHTVLQPQRYRTALMCDPARVGIYCTPYMANVWGLREIGGYVSAIPLRVSALPWPSQQVGFRSITLASQQDANWNLLALLNVQYVVEYHPALLTNAVREQGGKPRELRPSDLTIHRNPVPAVPRVYFARNVVAQRTMADVVNALFPGKTYDAATSDVRITSFVEGPPSLQQRYVVDGEVRAHFQDQFTDIMVTPSDSARFLVINERYHPGWCAYVDDVETPLLPTNVFMRGVVVPPHTTRIRLEFKPFSLSPTALPFYFGGVALVTAVSLIGWRLDQRFRANGTATA